MILLIHVSLAMRYLLLSNGLTQIIDLTAFTEDQLSTADREAKNDLLLAAKSLMKRLKLRDSCTATQGDAVVWIKLPV